VASPHSDLTAADRSLVRAALAFGGQGGGRIWTRFVPGWRDRLRGGWAEALTRVLDPEAALELLGRDHRDEARPDPARVHASWWVRALRDESPAVRLAVAARTPGPIAEAIRTGLGLEPGAIEAARGAAAHPGAVAVAGSLWAERIVGGPPPGAEDAPVVVALASLGPRALARLVIDLALAKWGYALAGGGAEPEAARRLRDRRRARRDAFRRGFEARGVEPHAARLAARDVAECVLGRSGDLRALGLVTVARLLLAVEPFRARWALQHLRYEVARYLRSRMVPPPRRAALHALIAWEAAIFEAAAERSRAEPRFTLPRPGGGPP
jgi:hypothetical protein